MGASLLTSSSCKITVAELGNAEPMPGLARLVAASLLEAAIHDAYGVALAQNSYNVLNPVRDGLPETLEQWILADGLTHLKIKLAGEGVNWDITRVIDVERVALGAQRQRSCEQWWYSLDFNEKCGDENQAGGNRRIAGGSGESTTGKRTRVLGSSAESMQRTY